LSLLSQARWLVLCLAVASLLPAVVDAKDRARVHEVRMEMSKDGTRAYFDPIGIHIQPGDTIRWVQISGYHSTTAYHPANGNHELRIPENAKPWDSDVLVVELPAKGSSFERVFHHEGVYDYFCKPHEAAGMVGRIVVGNPGSGPGARPFNYSPKGKWNPIPLAAQKQFPSIEEIITKSVIHPFLGEQSK
jgi:plastocyanin